MKQQQASVKNQKIQKKASQPPVRSKVSNRLSEHPSLQAQGFIGNHGMLRRYGYEMLQAKLKVGSPNDKYEQEADRVAELVMRMPELSCSECEEGELIQSKPFAWKITPLVQGQVEEKEEEEETIQPKAENSQSQEIASNLESRINAIRGGGQNLPASTRAFFEPRFGYDFSQARLHSDTEANTLNHSLNARAFTIGQDIFFRQGSYNPGSASGRRLLAHELTHIVQQNVDTVRSRDKVTTGLAAPTLQRWSVLGSELWIGFRESRRNGEWVQEPQELTIQIVAGTINEWIDSLSSREFWSQESRQRLGAFLRAAYVSPQAIVDSPQLEQNRDSSRERGTRSGQFERSFWGNYFYPTFYTRTISPPDRFQKIALARALYFREQVPIRTQIIAASYMQGLLDRFLREMQPQMLEMASRSQVLIEGQRTWSGPLYYTPESAETLASRVGVEGRATMIASAMVTFAEGINQFAESQRASETRARGIMTDEEREGYGLRLIRYAGYTIRGVVESAERLYQGRRSAAAAHVNNIFRATGFLAGGVPNLCIRVTGDHLRIPLVDLLVAHEPSANLSSIISAASSAIDTFREDPTYGNLITAPMRERMITTLDSAMM